MRDSAARGLPVPTDGRRRACRALFVRGKMPPEPDLAGAVVERYTMPIEALGIREDELLRVLTCIMEHRALPTGAEAMGGSLLKAGLARLVAGRPKLTSAGIARVQSLQLRVESDRDAARIRGERIEAVAGRAPYSFQIRDIGDREHDLLAVLLMVDAGQALPEEAAPLLQRLQAEGLVGIGDDGPVLTSAGIGRCQSLQRRVLSDTEAKRERDRRGQDEG